MAILLGGTAGIRREPCADGTTLCHIVASRFGVTRLVVPVLDEYPENPCVPNPRRRPSKGPESGPSEGYLRPPRWPSMGPQSSASPTERPWVPEVGQITREDGMVVVKEQVERMMLMEF